MPRHQLSLFLKAPLPGQVKTRLAASIGPDAATDAYRQLVETVLRRIRRLPNVELRFTPDNSGPLIEFWRTPSWNSSPQGPGDLGQRMSRAFEQNFESGCHTVTVIGSDCPYIQAADIEAAQEALKDADVVLGPATDGGYWLIALKHHYPQIFDGIAWSTPSVLAQTRQKAADFSLSVSLLETKTDIDSEETWRQWKQQT